MREVILAKSAGFCFGVRKAVELAEEMAESGRPFVMLGPVIHNDAVIKSLEAKGVSGVDAVEDVPAGVVVAGCPARIIKEKDERTASKTAIVDALRTL